MQRRFWFLTSFLSVFLLSLYIGVPVLAGDVHQPNLTVSRPVISNPFSPAAEVVPFYQALPFLVLLVSAGTIGAQVVGSPLRQEWFRTRRPFPAVFYQKSIHPSKVAYQTRFYSRFSHRQRIEHAVLLLSFTVLLLTGLPQMYYESWGHFLFRSLDTLAYFRQIHRLAGLVLILNSALHLRHGLVRMLRRQLSAEIFLSGEDIYSGIEYFRSIRFKGERPSSGKYRLEQKVTYWFFFFSIAILSGSGLLLLFPDFAARLLSGETLALAQIIHGSEATAALFFVLTWHLYHVLFHSPTFSIFTGRISGQQMILDNPKEYERLYQQSRTKVPGDPSSSVTNDQP